MGVNALIDNVGSQQMAVAESQSVAVALKELTQKDSRNLDSKKVQTQSDVSKLLQEGASVSKAGFNILVSLAGKLATMGVNLTPERFANKAQDSLEHEYNQLVGGESSYEDMVNLNSAVGRIKGQSGQQGNQQQSDGEQAALSEGKNLEATAQEYAAVYAHYMVAGSSDLKKRLVQLEQELTDNGLTSKDLHNIEKTAGASVRQELTEQIREAFLKKALSPQKSLEMVMSEKGLNNVLDFAILQDVHDNESLQSVADNVKQDVVEHLKDFAKEKIEEKLLRRHFADDPKEYKQINDELKELIKLGSRMGLKMHDFADQWQVKKFDLGLVIHELPVGQGQAGANPDSQRRPKEAYEFTPEDEKDLLANRLRALHMHRALSGDWKTLLETAFKMRKLKNGLIKLGISSGEIDRLKAEGRAVARVRLLEMLKTVLEERATLYELAGPAYGLIKQKIKGIMSNLERLDWKLSEDEFMALRDTANRQVCDAACQEYLTLRDITASNTNPAVDKRMSLVVKLIRRLQGESGIEAMHLGDNPVAEAV